MMCLGDEFWGIISYSMGCVSVLIWLCAQMPQILKNWRRKSVEGLSSGFLAAWIAGDASNLIGCFLTKQLGVQVLLASYYCTVDVVLVAQYYLYTRELAYLDGFDPFSRIEVPSGREDTNDNTNQPRKPSSGGRLRRACSSVVAVTGVTRLLGTAQAAPINALVSPSVAEDLVLGDEMQRHWSRDLGYAVAYFSTLMYVMSRLPQILHNFQRKSTTGVSMMLFISAFLGNLTYTLSILLSPQAMGENADTKAFLLNELSYIIGAAGTMLFDCIIVLQWYWYHRVTAHRRRSTQPSDRFSRPYLGESRLDTPVPQQQTPGRWASFSSTSTSATLPRKPSMRKNSRTSRGSTRFEVTPLLGSQHPSYGNTSNDESAVEN